MYEQVKQVSLLKSVKSGELTVPQVGYFITSPGELTREEITGVTYDTYRTIRKDPTIALARALIKATVLSGKWSIESDEDVDDEIVEFISETMMPLRDALMETAILGGIDFGWQTFEKVFDVVDGRIQLKKLKSLLQDISIILVDDKTGEFTGVKQYPLSGSELVMDTSKVMLVSFNVEGTYWYGLPMLENCRAAYNEWVEANKSAAAYDKKIAGSHFVVYYPPGTSTIEGVVTDNAAVAITLLGALENSGSITVPRVVVNFVDSLNEASENGWKVDMLEGGGGQQSSFVERLKYLDALKVRGLIVPERAVLEGQFGTKAEADSHGDMAIVNIQEMDKHITKLTNQQVVNQLLALNFGREYVNKVRLVSTPLVDEQVKFFKDMYKGILSNPEGFAQEFMTLDTDAMKDKLGLPKTEVVAEAPVQDGATEPVDPSAPESVRATEKLAAQMGLKLSRNSALELMARPAQISDEDRWITINGARVLIKAGEKWNDAIDSWKEKNGIEKGAPREGGKAKTSKPEVKATNPRFKKSVEDVKMTEFGRGWFVTSDGADLIDVSDDFGAGTNDHIGTISTDEFADRLGVDKKTQKLLKEFRSKADSGQEYDYEEQNAVAGDGLRQAWKNGALRVRDFHGSIAIDGEKVKLETVQKYLTNGRLPAGSKYTYSVEGADSKDDWVNDVPYEDLINAKRWSDVQKKKLSHSLDTSDFSAFKSAESIILSHSGRITDIDESSITAEFPSSDEMHKAQSQLSERK